MLDRLMTRQEVEKRTRLRRSTIYRMMRMGKFPAPVRVGLRAVRWPADEIENYLTNQPRATGEAGASNG